MKTWIAWGVMCFALVGCKTAQFSKTQKTHLIVYATNGWTNTGIKVERGQAVEVTASGTWSAGTEGDIDPAYGPSGFQKLEAHSILPSVGVGTLVGQIGNGHPFPIGKRLSFISMNNGPLLLCINDYAKQYGTYRGFLKVNIDLKSAPAPSDEARKSVKKTSAK